MYIDGHQFMPPTPLLRGDKELPPSPDPAGQPQHGMMPYVGDLSRRAEHVAQASPTGASPVNVTKRVRFVDGVDTAGNTYSGADIWQTDIPVAPRTSRFPDSGGLEGGVGLGARGNPYTPSGYVTPFRAGGNDPWTVHHTETRGNPYSSFDYGPEEDPFPKRSFWRRLLCVFGGCV